MYSIGSTSIFICSAHKICMENWATKLYWIILFRTAKLLCVSIDNTVLYYLWCISTWGKMSMFKMLKRTSYRSHYGAKINRSIFWIAAWCATELQQLDNHQPSQSSICTCTSGTEMPQSHTTAHTVAAWCAVHIKKLSWWLLGCCSSVVEKHLQLKLGALGIQGGCYFPLILSHNMFCSCSWMVVPECHKLHTVYANYLICLVINDSKCFCASNTLNNKRFDWLFHLAQQGTGDIHQMYSLRATWPTDAR